jgi:gliding motility-associated-like protein
VPNAFTPNGDGLNDLFKVVPDCEIETFELRIFNRWGVEVFSTDSPEEGWNGASPDADFFSSGTIYVYIITVQARNKVLVQEPIVVRGNVMVVR